MNALVYLIGTTVMFFIGYYLGMQQGHKDGKLAGFNEGLRVALQEIDQYMKGGLESPLDWDTAQRLMREKMSRN
ncbi:hypothetical protein ACKGJO_08790 [Gracilimonas sp. Q87]|uniref:hypothetical protein n=1 Tax=Gracilimonas sp. Q87 TaxID=3384766 RepID=UPI003983EB5D